MKINDNLITEIYNDIESADKILVGIGLEWLMPIETSDIMSADISAEELIGEKDIWYSLLEKKQRIELYNNLKSILHKKDYYIISLCYDDVIFDVFSAEDKVVTPCGGYRLLQCGNHIMTRDEAVIRDGKIVCPVCGCSLSYNNILNENYMEESYLPKFEEYKGWLQSTINKKLVVLELGTDMRFPQAIRFAFDRLVKFNLKSKMYRVNKSLCMVDSSSEGRGIAVKCDSMELVQKMK